MTRKSRQNPLIREFILRNTDDYPGSIVSMAMDRFGYSRQAVLRYIHRLVEEELITHRGNTNARRYTLKPLVKEFFVLPVTYLWSEHMVWRDRILPLMKGVNKNIIDICQYGFTEMLNNVLDHSSSSEVTISYRRSYAHLDMAVSDNGIGIFKKIQRDFKLEDPRAALLELSKGKLTSDRKNHSGEGIYFTSRMFDRFRIRSGNLFYSRGKKEDDGWLIEVNDRTADRPGTMITMRIKTDADWTMRDVFDQYQGDNMRFRKTHVPIKLMQYPGEQLVSRSQAKRVLARFDNFSEVFLDFQDVEQIGQAFADEIFRVFREEHPDIDIRIYGANEDVRKMIAFVQTEKVVD